MEPITIDLETYYDRDYTLKKMTIEEFVNDPRFELLYIGYKIGHNPATVWDAANKGRAEIRNFLNSLELHKRAVVGYNLPFDGSILAWHYGQRFGAAVDVASMARPLLYHDMAREGLGATAKFLGLDISKGTEVLAAMGRHREDFTDEEWEQYGAYCANDVELTYQIAMELAPCLPLTEVKLMDITTRMYTHPMLKLDRKLLKDAADTERRALHNTLASVGMEMEDLRSDARFAEALTNIGVTPEKKVSATTGKLAWAFAKTDPQMIRLVDHPEPRVRALAEARLQAKSSMQSSRVARFLGIASRMSNMPVPLRYWGARTGRYSGDGKVNMQNLTNGSVLREAVMAPPGHVIIAVDQCQIEARLNATLSGQYDLVGAFARGDDVYLKLAEVIYGRRLNKKTNPDERFIGKTAILGLGYGMGAQRFHAALAAKKVEVDEDFCQHTVSTYRSKYPAIVRNWKTAAGCIDAMYEGHSYQWGPFVTEHEALVLPNGLRIYYPELTREEGSYGWEYTYRTPGKAPGRFSYVRLYGPKLVENAVQAGARQIVTDQMVVLDAALRQYRARIVLQAHDEIVIVAPADAADEVVRRVTEIMTEPPAWMIDVPLAVEGKVGTRYSDCK